jgi:UDP-N-acetylglucosamine 2-epimerase (non-hydrolysing)
VKIIHVVGARPNFMKRSHPRWPLAEKPRVEQRLVHTGPHYDVLSDVFFQDLDLREPDYFLGTGSGSHSERTARIC